MNKFIKVTTYYSKVSYYININHIRSITTDDKNIVILVIASSNYDQNIPIVESINYILNKIKDYML